MKRPLVSVITPSFNQAAYLGQCLDTVLGQTLGNLEQIVIDDGSTDETREILERYDDTRLTTVYQEHLGIGGLHVTYNRALSSAQGQFVAICEADDFWSLNALEELVPLILADTDTVLAFGVTQLVSRHGWPLPKFIPAMDHMELRGALTNDPVGSAVWLLATGHTFCFPVSTIVRRSTLERIGGFLQPSGLPFVDQPTFLRLAVEGPFRFSDRVVGYWRQRLGSATASRDEMAVYESLASHGEDFVEMWRSEVAAVMPESGAVTRAVDRMIPDLLARVGRRELLRSRWSSARGLFVRLTRHPHTNLVLRVAAVIGLVASLLHTTLEPLARLLWGPERDLRWVYALDRSRGVASRWSEPTEPSADGAGAANHKAGWRTQGERGQSAERSQE